MDWSNQIRGILAKYLDREANVKPGVRSGTAEGPATVADVSRVHRDFDEIARRAPRDVLADGLGHAFRSGSTSPFGQLVAHLFGQSSAEQRAGLLGVLAALRPASASDEFLAFAGREITPADAQKVPPATVEKLAAEAARHDPAIVDRVSDFYAGHPNLLKTFSVEPLIQLITRIGERLAQSRTSGGAA